MTVSETVLVVLLQGVKTKLQKTIILQKYIQAYGGISEEAGNKIREIMNEVDNETQL